MMKKVFAILVAAMVVLTMASCGSGGSTTPASGDETSGSAVTPSATDTADSNGAKVFVKAAGSKDLPDQAKARTDTLVMGSETPSGAFNPWWSENLYDQYVHQLVFPYLSTNDAKGNIIDGTAHLTISDDGLTYTYKLKPDKFSDGTPVTAKDYELAMKLLSDKSYDGYLDLSTTGIVGWKDFHDGKTKDLAGIKVVDDSTLQITLEQPNSEAIYNLALPAIDSAKYGSMIKPGDVSAYKKACNDMVNYVSNGAYTITSVKTGESVTLKANPNYLYGEPKIPNIIIKVVPAGSEMEAVITGDVDVEMDRTAETDIKDLLSSVDYVNATMYPELGYAYAMFNIADPKFSDVRVRQALMYAMDRKGICQATTGNPDYFNIINIPQTPVSWVYDDSGCDTYDFNIDKAQELFKEAGWIKNAEGKLVDKTGKQFKITLLSTGDTPFQKNLKNSLLKTYAELGIDMQVSQMDFATAVSNVENGKFDMISMGWSLTPDPDVSFCFATKGSEAGGTQNQNGYSNPDLDKLLIEAHRTIDLNKEKEIYSQIFKILNHDLPNLPVYEGYNLFVANTRVKGATPSSFISPFQQDQVSKLYLDSGDK